VIGVTDGHQSGAKSGDAFEEAPHPHRPRSPQPAAPPVASQPADERRSFGLDGMESTGGRGMRAPVPCGARNNGAFCSTKSPTSHANWIHLQFEPTVIAQDLDLVGPRMIRHDCARESDDPLERIASRGCGLRHGDDTGVAELVKYIEPTLQDTFSDEPHDDSA
jgi:hypothetical protein